MFLLDLIRLVHSHTLTQRKTQDKAVLSDWNVNLHDSVSPTFVERLTVRSVKVGKRKSRVSDRTNRQK